MLQKVRSIVWKFKFVLVGAIAIGGFFGWQAAQQKSMTLLALDNSTGTVQWFQPLGSWRDSYSRGALVAGGIVILESAESSTPEQKFDTYRLQAFSAQSGSLQWTKQFNPPAQKTAIGFGYELASNSMIDLQPTALYFQLGRELRSLDPTTGEQRWSIQRPWFNTTDSRLWLSLGLAATQQRLGVLQLDSEPDLIQFLDAATGKIIRQTTLPTTERFTNFSRITQSDRDAFTTSRISNSEQSIATAYRLKTGQVLFRTQSMSINNLQAVDRSMLLSTDTVFNFQDSKPQVDGRIMALDAQTGRSLWQKTNSELQCINYSRTWQADARSVYLNCDRRLNNYRKSSTIVALSTQTGEPQWQTLVSPNQHSDDIPIAIGRDQLLTLRNVSREGKFQTQAIGLDRQTGKLLWRVALFDDRAEFFRSRVATSGNQFFLIDEVPHWQLWLLQLNRHWFLNPAIVVREDS